MNVSPNPGSRTTSKECPEKVGAVKSSSTASVPYGPGSVDEASQVTDGIIALKRGSHDERKQVNVANDTCTRGDKLRNYSNLFGIWHLALYGSHRIQVKVIQFMKP